ncbi:MAG: Na(+)/H(+) antiporter subunit D [bacterium]|nr:Na(+)/H(+) antiporter subunit D [bacterium]
MTDLLPPAAIMIVGALLLPLIPSRARPWAALALPVASAAHLLALPMGHAMQLSLFGYDLQPVRVDGLSLVFGTIFHIAAILAGIYALHVRSATQHVAGMIYAGAAIGAVFAGDLLTLFVYWELTAISSVFLIWARGTERANRAGMRYLIVQIGSGVALLAGSILHLSDSGSLAFGSMSPSSPGTWLIFLAFGIKCAFPLLHNWLQDAYPEATVTGTVFLSAFTTKLAIYAMARGFPGTEILIPLGVVMAAFPIFYAAIEDDLRRVLAYSLNNQLGFMLIGVGIGTPLALNGTAAHAFCHILYKSLLFMSMGAVLHRTGTIKGSQLGGLYKSMPWTTLFCIVGSLSIAGFPLFSGFISKSMIVTATTEAQLLLPFLALLFATAGAFHHIDIKVPFFAFFAKDAGIRCKEAPWNMLLAMAIAAFLCVAVALPPGTNMLYAMLPHAPVDYAAYTPTHVWTQLQILLFSALAFSVLLRSGIYPLPLRSTNLDTDWLYRRLAPSIVRRALARGASVQSELGAAGARRLEALRAGVHRRYGPEGVFARTWATGSAVLWVVLLLAVILALYYF